MEYAGLRPEDIAIELRCSASTVRNYISGRTKISWATLNFWADACGVNRRWLATGDTSGPHGNDGLHVSASIGSRRHRHLSIAS